MSQFLQKQSIARGSFYFKFREAMRGCFVNIDEYAYAIALAAVSQRNLVAWGPGGHAKSEGIQYALSLFQEREDEAFFLSCGEGMTEERLFGGVDLRALDESHIIQYNTERSFLPARFGVFEEGLDMPDAAALSLRDTLTARKLRNGRQVVPMLTECLFLLTNREPKSKAGLDVSYKALLERFPLQLRVSWDSYTGDDYTNLIDRVESRKLDYEDTGALAADLRAARQLYSQVSMGSMKRVLADLLEKAGHVGEPVSPRSTIAAVELVKAAAAARGSNQVETQDLLALRFLPTLANVEDLQREIQTAIANDEAERHIGSANTELESLLEELKSASTPADTRCVCARLDALHARVATLNLGNNLAQRRRLAYRQ